MQKPAAATGTRGSYLPTRLPPQLSAITHSLPPIRKQQQLSAGAAPVRQTLLFSATVPASILSVAAEAMRPGYAMIDIVSKDSHDSHAHVLQEFMVVPVSTPMACGGGG